MTKPAYDYLPADVEIPPLYGQENVKDPIVHVKLFTPDSNWTWYITEANRDEGLCFGFVQGLEGELGYIDLNEIREARGPLGLPIERDIHWTPRPLSEAKGK